ncbi:ferritin family protein [Candidatus Margulisiibacteriota bacterium]
MSELTGSLQAAISMEQKGYELYKSAADKTSNKLGKEILEAIAKKELDHIAAIEKFSSDIGAATKSINPKNKEDYILPIVENLRGELEDKVKSDSDLAKAYEVAMGMERESYALYKKLLGEAKDPKAKKFFEFLMGEETTHYELLQETLEYLNHPGDWFKEQEKWIVEG